MDLAKYQQLYLNTVYDYFQEKADWPTYRQVEINILPAHRDFNVVEIAKSLVDESHKHLFRVRDLNQPTYLSLDEIRRCPGSEKDLENLIKVVRYSADK